MIRPLVPEWSLDSVDKTTDFPLNVKRCYFSRIHERGMVERKTWFMGGVNRTFDLKAKSRHQLPSVTRCCEVSPSISTDPFPTPRVSNWKREWRFTQEKHTLQYWVNQRSPLTFWELTSFISAATSVPLPNQGKDFSILCCPMHQLLLVLREGRMDIVTVFALWNSLICTFKLLLKTLKKHSNLELTPLLQPWVENTVRLESEFRASGVKVELWETQCLMVIALCWQPSQYFRTLKFCSRQSQTSSDKVPACRERWRLEAVLYPINFGEGRLLPFLLITSGSVDQGQKGTYKFIVLALTPTPVPIFLSFPNRLILRLVIVQCQCQEKVIIITRKKISPRGYRGWEWDWDEVMRSFEVGRASGSYGANQWCVYSPTARLSNPFLIRS